MHKNYPIKKKNLSKIQLHTLTRCQVYPFDPVPLDSQVP